MPPRLLPLGLLPTLLLLGGAPAPAGADEPLPASLEGYYRARGVTTEEASRHTRPIEGTILVTALPEGDDAGEGEGYALRFSFRTKRTTPDGSLRADLIGIGSGRVDDGALLGRTETQVIVAAIPGIDPQFAFIPGRLGPRIVSDFRMRAGDAAERFHAEIETRPAAGFEYAATRTRLDLERISRDTPEDDRLPLPKPYDD